MDFFPMLAIYLSAVSVWIIYGLFSLWVGSQTWHWAIRVTLTMVSVLPALAIEAPDLLLVLLTSNLVVLVAISIAASRRRGDLITRLQLADLLYATATIAVLISLSTLDLTGQQISLAGALGLGVLIGACLLFGVWLALGRASWKFRLAIGVVAFIGIGVVQSAQAATMLQGTQIVIWSSSWATVLATNPTFAIALCSLTCAFLVGYRVQLAARQGGWLLVNASKFRRRAFRAMWLAPLIAVLLMSCFSIVFVYGQLLRTYHSVVELVPAGAVNGYVELLEAGAELEKGTALQSIPQPGSRAVMRPEIDRFDDEFEKVRRALSRPVLTAATWSNEPVPMVDMWKGNGDEVTAVRAIARALSVKAIQELAEENADVAISDGCQCLRLRIPMSRSKVLVNELCGIAFESMGFQPVHDSIPAASDKALLKATRTLNELNSLPSDAEAARKADLAVFWSRSNWKYRLFSLIWQWSDVDVQDQNIQDSMWRNEAIRHQLLTRIALERFRRNHRRFPETLNDLLPEYLSELPRDPFATDGRLPLRYTAQANGEQYLLYSLGPNRTDEGGQIDEEDPWGAFAADINFAEARRRELAAEQEAAAEFEAMLAE